MKVLLPSDVGSGQSFLQALSLNDILPFLLFAGAVASKYKIRRHRTRFRVCSCMHSLLRTHGNTTGWLATLGSGGDLLFLLMLRVVKALRDLMEGGRKRMTFSLRSSSVSCSNVNSA